MAEKRERVGAGIQPAAFGRQMLVRVNDRHFFYFRVDGAHSLFKSRHIDLLAIRVFLRVYFHCACIASFVSNMIAD